MTMKGCFSSFSLKKETNAKKTCIIMGAFFHMAWAGIIGGLFAARWSNVNMIQDKNCDMYSGYCG